MRLTSVTVGPLAAASATNIAQAQAVAGAGNLTLNGTTVSGGVATLDMARKVLITNAGNDSGITFTVYGTDWAGNSFSETVTGSNASTVATTQDFLTVTRVAASGAAAGNVSVGTNGVAASRPIFLDNYGKNEVSLQVDVTGTVNATVQTSLDDPTVSRTGVNWVNSADSAVVGLTANQQSNFAYMPNVVRIVLNSGTGSVTMKVLQSGGHP